MLRKIFPILALFILMQGCASTPAEDTPEGMDVKELYQEANAALQNSNYEEAISLYETLESRFPYGKYAQRAQMEVAYAYYKHKEPESAIVAADRFIKLHPNHPNVDYMYYLRGLASYDMSRNFIERMFDQDPSERDPKAARRAFRYFAELVRKFPESRYTEDAIERMRAIRDNLAKYELHVANYYMKRGAYLAAANRGKYVVENYQRTPSVADALALMVDAYQRLGMEELAADTRRVLELNHPEHESLKSTGAQDASDP